MKRLRIIINNGAGAAHGHALIRDAKQKLWGWECEYLQPQSLEETREFCAGATPEKFEAIIICGGDGTLNQALPALIGSEVPIALFPVGTANDLASELGVNASWEELQTLLDNRFVKSIDVVRINSRYFTTVGGLGLGAALTHKVNELRTSSRIFRGLWSHMKSEMYAIMTGQLIASGKCRACRLMISSDNFSRDLWVSSLLVANQSYLGSDILVAPKAANDDGVFDVVILALDNRIELLRSMLGAKLGQSFPANHRFTASRCRVEALDGLPIPVFGDGELLFSAPILDFELLPRALKVYCDSRRRSTPVMSNRTSP